MADETEVAVTSTDETESALQERLKRVEYDTLDGSTCRATITDITTVDRSGQKVRVTVELPSGRTHSERFDVPEVASDRYRFVRLLNGTGYGLSALDSAIGANVDVEITDDGPEIVVPDPDRSVRDWPGAIVDRVPNAAVVGVGLFITVATFPLTGYHASHQFIKQMGFEPDVFITWYTYAMGLVLWAVIAACVLGVMAA